MLTAEVRKANEITGKKVVVGNGHTVKWHEVWEHNPRMSRTYYPGAPWVNTIKGNRPYIDYTKTNKLKMAWKPWKVEPGEIYLTESEKTKDTGFVYIEPNIKGSFGGNKDWGFDNWQKVVDALLHIRWIQGPGRRLRGVEQRDTGSFRGACGLLSGADFFVGTDGALHHASAALGRPAVVVWGGLIGPEILGYDTHINLRAKGVKDCGSIAPCLHCRSALQQVSVDMVVKAVSSLVETLKGRQQDKEDRLVV